MDNKYNEEYLALERLKFYFGTKLHNFEKREEPDFGNIRDNVGLEITQSNFDGEQIKILQEIHGKNYTYNEAVLALKKYDKKGKFKGEIGRTTPKSNSFYSSLTKGMVDTNIYFDAIINVIDKKLKKLQKFQIFKRNFLYIIDHGHILENYDVLEYLLPNIIQVESNYKICFDGYFIEQYNRIIYIINHHINYINK